MAWHNIQTYFFNFLMKMENMLGTRSVIIEYLPSYKNTCSLQIQKINGEGMEVNREKQKKRRNEYQGLIMI